MPRDRKSTVRYWFFSGLGFLAALQGYAQPYPQASVQAQGCYFVEGKKKLNLEDRAPPIPDLLRFLGSTEVGRRILLKAVPLIRDGKIKIRFDARKLKGVLGKYDYSTGFLYLDPDTQTGSLVEILAHELTHATDQDAKRELKAYSAKIGDLKEQKSLETFIQTSVFKRERRAYANEALFVRETWASLPCYKFYLMAHAGVGPHAISMEQPSDSEIVEWYHLDPYKIAVLSRKEKHDIDLYLHPEKIPHSQDQDPRMFVRDLPE